MTDEDKVWDGAERQKAKLTVITGNGGGESSKDGTAAVEAVIHAVREKQGDIGKILILYETKDGKRLASLDNELTPAEVNLMVDTFKSWLIECLRRR